MTDKFLASVWWPVMSRVVIAESGPWIDLHSHAGDPRRLEEARAAGVTVLTLVHYRVNEIGDVQTAPPVHGGLSRLGRDVVAECGRLGIVVDCARQFRRHHGRAGGIQPAGDHLAWPARPGRR